MYLVRYGEKGKERPGILKGSRVVDLASHLPGVPDIGPEFFAGGWLEKAREVDAKGEILSQRLGPPVTRPEKIICLGKNYADHAKEGNMDVPERPLLFCKTPNTLNGPEDDILLPKSSGRVDWEVELCVVMGRGGKGISREEALSRVAGFCVMNDVSGREAQFGDGQWFRGKSFDTFAPLGPVLATPDEVDLASLTLKTRVNGRLMQHGTTADMLFDVPSIIEFISRDITLAPGDLVSTGTPAGVGIFRDPPVTLSPGDLVECFISGLGTLRNRVRG
ncbi:MAG: fumarylacetoacetate hydrolase family protein [Deltaproteobacteria bacterium]|nr:fumarylacetoacetate hydrolase family protein [Deltaproteobacteria bacterium]